MLFGNCGILDKRTNCFARRQCRSGNPCCFPDIPCRGYLRCFGKKRFSKLRARIYSNKRVMKQKYPIRLHLISSLDERD